jgi:adenylate kinase family enzyme
MAKNKKILVMGLPGSGKSYPSRQTDQHIGSRMAKCRQGA